MFGPQMFDMFLYMVTCSVLRCLPVCPTDVSDEDSISSVVQTLTEQLKHTGLNLLINNAAIVVPAMPGPLSETTKKDMMDVYNTNVAGPFLLSKMLLPLLVKAAETHRPEKDKGSSMSCRRSAIINVSTLAGSIEKCPENFHMAPIYPYRTSKAALNMLTRCQAVDFKVSNVLVTAIHPGWVRTEMGGAQAPLNTQDSVQGMLTVMSSLSDKDSGVLVSWEGERIPW
uniref:Uncharacterized protein n=1 Tax=Sphaeramia orbicularis TaxID=375764 RepID=A0A672ZY57_9TELE